MRVWKVLCLSLAMILFAAVPPALANSAEPPGYTVIVPDPPEGLALFLAAEGSEPVPLSGEKRGWETWYRFYYHTLPGGRERAADGMLRAQWDGGSADFAIPETQKAYNNVLLLDPVNGVLRDGQPPWRVPVLVALRVALTLLIEGAVFFLFGYRSRRSWLVFLAVNLLTQGWLNAMITGPNIGVYWMLGFVAMEAVILAAEMAAMAFLLREKTKGRAILYAAAANLASLLAGGWILTNLPV